MNTFVDYFRENFYHRLLKPNGNNPIRNRADSLQLVFQILEKQQKYVVEILETGCMRPDHGELCFGDDGCFTYIISEYLRLRQSNGFYFDKFHSVDIEQKNIDYAKLWCPNADLHCMDSVKYLYLIEPSTKFDLIYLDSFDIYKDNPHPSQLHHLKELCAVLKNTKPGTIIVVDDHDAFFTGGKIGKGNYVKDFMLNINAKILYEGYQIVFQL